MLNLIEAADFTQKDLTTAIIRDPITVSPKVTVREAIALMSGARSHCETDFTVQSELHPLQAEARASCVVVVESHKVIGILTERDVVRLCANQQTLDGLLVSQAMTASVLTLRESAFTDLFSAINLLQQNHIRHLPLVDDQDCLVGLVLHETLRQVLQPSDLLRLRLVQEVMVPAVITTTLTDSLLTVAQCMASNRVSSVVVVKREHPEDLPIPIGIVTERDLVQFQALELDFERYCAAQVMSHPVITVSKNETLVTVQQLMDHYPIHRIVVTGEAGELLGIVTQTNVLQALSPLELYKLTEVLEARIKQLEVEKLDALQSRNLELEQQIALRVADVHQRLRLEQVITNVATVIRASLHLQTILDTAVEQIRQVINCDRVNIWKLEPDLSSVVVAEATQSTLSLLGEHVKDACYQHRIIEIYSEEHIRVVPDIYTTEMTDCHRELLIRLKTRAKVLLPLFCGNRLWGLLHVSESQAARDWQAHEVDFLQTVSTHLAIAIQQASTHEQLQIELQERQQVEVKLQESKQQYAKLAALAPVGIFYTDAVGNCTYVNDRWCQISGLTPEESMGTGWMQALHPDDRYAVAIEWYKSAKVGCRFQFEYRFLRDDGTVTWVFGQSENETDTRGNVIGYVGTITDITERKSTETLLQIKNDLLARVAAQEPLTDTLHYVCTTIEGMLDGAICSILLLDSNNQLREGASPSLPEHYRRQVDGIQAGEGIGSCGTAVHRREKVIVADIANDPLWQDFKDLALAAGLQACWSTPIIAVDRSILGTFAIYYREVRSPRADEMTLVDNAVHIVMLAIQRHHNEITLKQTTQRLQEAQRIAHLGNWEFDLQHNTLHWSEEVFRIFETDPQQFGASYEAFLNLVHPEDRNAVEEAYNKHLRDRKPYGLVHRIQMADGRVKHVQEQCETINCADGTTIISRGTVQDVTQQKEAEIRRDQAETALRQVIEGTSTFTGEAFFPALVRHISEALGVRYVLVSQATPEGFQVLAFFADGELRPTSFLPYESVPRCTQALKTGSCCHPRDAQAQHPDQGSCCHPRADQAQHPDHGLFAGLQIDSYLGVGLRNAADEPIGNLCILHDAPLANPEWAKTLLSIFAARAGAELERLLMAQALEQLNVELEARVAKRTEELWEREVQLSDLFDNATDLIQSIAPDGQILFVNRAWRETLGYDDADLKRLSIFDIIHPNDLHHCRQRMQDLFNGAPSLGIETRFLTKDGREIVVEGNVNCQMKDGKPVATRGIFRDVTDRKQAENALHESQQFLQTVLDTVPLSVFWKDRNSQYLGANSKFLQDAALSSISDLVGKTDLDLPWGDTEAEAYRADDCAIMDTGEVRLGIIETQHQQDGTKIWLETNKLPLRNLAGDIVGVLGTYQDITARRSAELALQRQLAAIEAAIDGIAILQDGRYLYLNSSHVKMFGYERAEDLIGHTWQVVYSPEELERFEQEIFPVLLEHKSWQGEVVATRRDGTTFPEQLSLSFSADNLLICVCQDISDRKQAEAALRESERRYFTLTQTAPVAIFRFDLEGCCIYVNERWCEMTGKSIAFAISDRWLETIHPDDRERTQTAILHWMQDGAVTPFQNEARILRNDGTTVWFYCQMLLETDTSGQPIGYVGTLTDISDRKAAETIIHQQAERETLLREITQRIRQSLDLQTIFDTACQEIRSVLQADRVGIFKFYPESNYNDGEFVAESMVEKWPSVVAVRVHDHCFGENYMPLYTQGRFHAVDDIENTGLSPCHSGILAQFGVRANLVLPLMCGEKLWGLLCLHQCSGPRQWQETEIDLMQQLATQLGIAIQQASLYEQVQSELLERQQAEAKIALQLRRQQTLANIIQIILQRSLDLDEILATVVHQVKEILNGDRVIIFRLCPDGQSQILQESVSDGLPSLQNKHWENEVWSQDILNHYWQGQPRIVPDVMDDRWTECLVEYSLEGNIQSKIVAPILQEIRPDESHRWVSPYVSNKLWGILVIHACTEKRVWLETEAQLLQQIANQVAIAIQKANLFEQLQQELAERKQAQKQLTERNQQLALTNAELARATHLKDEFLANMSHELRTPLNAILGMSEGLQDAVFGTVNERQLRALRTIETSATHLLDLINDILDVAKIESGQISLEYSQVFVEQMCSSSVAFIKQQAFKKQIRLETHISPHLPSLYIDERRIRQALLNLLTNAVKFTPEGGTVTLTASLLPAEADIAQRRYLRIAVTDTGIGIAPENVNKLFQPFVQIDSALNREYTGTGLGLALVKQIVELHNGHVGLTSELGVGSCFTIDLPYDLTLLPDPMPTYLPITHGADPAALSASEPTFSQSPLVLLAEDNPANVATLSSYLEAKGYRLLYASNGQEAIDLALSHHPDVILMDIQMPGMDGLDAMRHIRQQESLHKTPIIALTALAMKGDREDCLRAGADDYLSKPVRFKQLDSSIKKLLANHESDCG